MTDSVAEVLKKKSFNPSEIEIVNYIEDLKVIELKYLAKAFQDEAEKLKKEVDYSKQYSSPIYRDCKEYEIRYKALKKERKRFLLYAKLCKGNVKPLEKFEKELKKTYEKSIKKYI